MTVARQRRVDKPKIDRRETNKAGIIAACNGLENRVNFELKQNAKFSGVISLTVVVIDGYIDRHQAGVNDRRSLADIWGDPDDLATACNKLKDRITFEIESASGFYFGSISINLQYDNGQIVDTYFLIDNSNKNTPVYN